MTTPQKPSNEAPPAEDQASATPPAEDKAPAKPPAEDKTSVTPPAASSAPVLAGDLTRGCQRGGDGTAGLAVGALAVDFTLDDTTGVSHTLSQMLARQPVVMVAGSFT